MDYFYDVSRLRVLSFLGRVEAGEQPTRAQVQTALECCDKLTKAYLLACDLAWTLDMERAVYGISGDKTAAVHAARECITVAQRYCDTLPKKPRAEKAHGAAARSSAWLKALGLTP